MKRIALKMYGKLWAGLFGIIGFFTRCDSFEPRAEYGTPSANYIVKGEVADSDSKNPISGIRVIRQSDYSSYRNDTVLTNNDGEYEIRFGSSPTNEVTVYAEDIDGMENGAYETDTLRIKIAEFKKIKKGSGSWYQGTFEKKAVNFNLNPVSLAEYGIRPTSFKKISKK